MLAWLCLLAQAGPLLEELKSESIEVRERAGAALESLGPEALPVLDAASRGETEVAERARRAAQIIRLREALPERHKGRAAALVRDDAACAEFCLREPFIKIPELERRALRGARSVKERWRLLDGLRADDVVALEPEIAALAHDPDDGVAVRASLHIWRRTGLGAIVRRIIQSQGRWTYHVEDPDARAAIDGALVQLLRDPDATVRAGAARSLGSAFVQAAIPELENLLGDDQPCVRAAAVRALTSTRATTAVARIRALLVDPDGGVRHAAVDAVESFGNVEAVDALIPLTGDDDAYVRHAAIGALDRLDGVAAIPALERALEDESADVRSRAIWALLSLESISSSNRIEPCVRDKDAGVRSAAAWALGRLGDASATLALAAALKDDDFRVRDIAAESLCLVGSEWGVPELLSGSEVTAINAVRRPRQWAKLTQRVGAPRSVSVDKLEALVKETTGLTVRWEVEARLRRDVANNTTLWEALAGSGALIVEDDAVRIVPGDKARDFFTSWWADRMRAAGR